MSDKNKKSSFASALKEKYGDFKKSYKKSQKQQKSKSNEPSIAEQINFGGKYKKKKKSSGY